MENDLNNTQLCKKAGISIIAMDKMGKNEIIKTETLLKIYNTLNCEIDNILEYME
ncbi:MAG: helix-turn-helix domain-containing protein [Bacteroidetes bacterium]|nr:helix-turn-helix domain-containing protein [Bacteroidota bacterium]